MTKRRTGTGQLRGREVRRRGAKCEQQVNGHQYPKEKPKAKLWGPRWLGIRRQKRARKKKCKKRSGMGVI